MQHVLRGMVALALSLMAAGTSVFGQPQKPITNADIIDMVSAKLSDQVVLNTIRDSSGRNFDLSPSGLIALKKAGVSDVVIAAMQQSPGANRAQPSPPVAAALPGRAGAFAQQQITANDIPQLRQAAQKGDAAAEYKLAVAYRDGAGVAQDFAEANVHFGLAFFFASDLSSSSRVNRYGSKEARRYDREQQPVSDRLTAAQVEQANNRIAQELERLANQGIVKAEFLTGVLRLNGNGPAVPKDPSKGVEWLRKAADRGFAPAQAELGEAYINGKGVRADMSQGFTWIRKAAEQNHAQAQYRLGTAYYLGRGLPQNPQEGLRWIFAAATWGHADAQGFLGTMATEGNKVLPQDYGQAVKWSRMAADQGLETAQFNLGWLYANGHGVARDDIEAYKWMNLAVTRLQDEPDLLPTTVRTQWATARESIAARLTTEQRAEGDRRAREWSTAVAARE
jgi:uncharacterized protein